MEKRLITVKDLAIYISSSEGSIYQMIFRREIPGNAIIKIGRAVRFDIEEIDKWLEENRAKE